MRATHFAPEFRVEVGGTRMAADVTKNITDVSVTLATGAIDALSLTLANPYPALRWTHTSDEKLFREGNSIRVWMGYAGAPLVLMFDGEATGITPSFPASGSPTLKVEGLNRLHRLQEKSGLITLQDATDGDMARQIAAASGLGAEVDDPGTTYPQLSTGGEAHLPYLLERARAVRREVWVEGTTLHFGAPREKAASKYTLVWGRTRESFVEGSLPLQSFTPTMDVRNQVGTVIVRGQDPLTREVIEGRVGEGDEDARLGEKTGAQVREAALKDAPELVVTCEPVTSRAEAEDRARAIYNERSMEFVQGSGTTLGLPGLRPGTVVMLRGLGPRFSGRYYVHSATHSLGGGGYQTTFGARSNAVGS